MSDERTAPDKPETKRSTAFWLSLVALVLAVPAGAVFSLIFLAKSMHGESNANIWLLIIPVLWVLPALGLFFATRDEEKMGRRANFFSSLSFTLVVGAIAIGLALGGIFR